MLIRLSVTALVVAALLWQPAAELVAQQELAELTALRGIVVDGSTGAAIPGAGISVGSLERRAFTSENGRFSLPDVEPGTYTVLVTQIGYDTLVAEVEVEEQTEPYTFRLSPDPVLLARVAAVVDRFAARRNAIASSVRVFDQEGLRNSGAYDALEFIRMRTAISPVPCPNRLSMRSCAYVRGRPTPVNVVIDGTPVLAGLEMLASYRPDELYLLEVIGGGRSIWAYTNWFVEEIAKGRRLPPIFYF